jgi:hypothetical protein
MMLLDVGLEPEPRIENLLADVALELHVKLPVHQVLNKDDRLAFVQQNKTRHPSARQPKSFYQSQTALENKKNAVRLTDINMQTKLNVLNSRAV